MRRLLASWIDGAVFYGGSVAVITAAELGLGLRLPLEPVIVVLACALGAWLLRRDGRTPGKLLCGLRVTRVDGAPLGLRHALAREALGKWVLPLGVPLVVARLLVGQGWIPTVYDLLVALGVFAIVGVRCAVTGRTWHDRIAGTQVELAPCTGAPAIRALGIVAGSLALAATIASVTYRARGWIPAKLALYRDPAPIGRYVDFLDHTTATPVDYVMQLFDRFDVVILSENAHVEATQWDFIFDLVRDPRFVAGVGRVFTENGYVEEQPALDRFLTTPGLPQPEVDRRAVALMRNIADAGNTGWDNTNLFRYLQRLYRLNEGLPPGKRVRHFFTDRDPGWQGQTRESVAAYERKVIDRDKRMARTVIEQLAREQAPGASRPKALVIMNFRHAFAPIQLFGEPMDNAGRYLFEAFPGRTANVLLGPYIVPFVYAPLQRGRWDAAWDAIANRPLGFDLAGSPFGDDAFDLFPLPGPKGRYHYRDVFTGMMLITPLRQQVFETGIPGYLDGFETELLRRAELVSDAQLAATREQIAWYRAGMPGRRTKHWTFAFQTTVEWVTFSIFALGLVWALVVLLVSKLASRRQRAQRLVTGR